MEISFCDASYQRKLGSNQNWIPLIAACFYMSHTDQFKIEEARLKVGLFLKFTWLPAIINLRNISENDC